MVRLDVEMDEKFFKQLKIVSSEAGRKSMCSAINDSLKSGKTSLKRETSKIYNIKQKEVDSNSKVNRCTENNLKKGNIKIEGRRLTIGTSTHFSHTPREYSTQRGVKVSRRKKISVTVKKGSKKKMPHAFIVNPGSIHGGNTMIWIRERSKIAPVKTVSIPQMVENDRIKDNISKTMIEKYHNRFEHYWNRNMKKMR